MAKLLYIAGVIIIMSGLISATYLYDKQSGAAMNVAFIIITLVGTFFSSITFFALAAILDRVDRLSPANKSQTSTEDDSVRSKFTERFH